jgi:hypothetical protein
MDHHTDLIEALAAVPAGNTSVATLRSADRAIDDLPRRLVDAIALGGLSLEPGLDGASDSLISFGLLAVVKWLAELGPERLACVPASFFVARLAGPDKKLRSAAVLGLAHYPEPALQWFDAHASAEAVETRELAASLVAPLFRNEHTTPDDARRLVPVLEKLCAGLRGQGKKDASDALAAARAQRLSGFRAAIASDDVDEFGRFFEGEAPDGRMPGELSKHFTYLAEACSRGARRIAALLLQRGADPSRAVLGLACSTSVEGLELLLEVAPIDAAALQTALEAAVFVPHVKRYEQARALAKRLPSIDVRRVVAHDVPLLVSLARLGLLEILEGQPDQSLLDEPLDVPTLERLRTSNLALRDGASAADVVAAAAKSLEASIREQRRHGMPSLEELERMESLTRCTAWLEQRGMSAEMRDQGLDMTSAKKAE